MITQINVSVNFLERLRANGQKTWAELHYRPIEYKPSPAYHDEELTPAQEAARLEDIRARPLAQRGMSVVLLMEYAERLSWSDRKSIADRCFSDTPLSIATLHNLVGNMGADDRQQALIRLRMKP